MMELANQEQNQQAAPHKPFLFIQSLSEKPKINFNLSRRNWFGYRKLEKGEIYIEWFKHFSFLVSADGRSISCFCNDENIQVSSYLKTQVYSFALLNQGYESLHGSLIEKNGITLAFIGDSGRGKSTLTTHFIAKGWNLIGDDLIVFNQNFLNPLNPLNSTSLYCYPGDPFLKLQPKVWKHFFSDRHENSLFNNFTKKKIAVFPQVPFKTILLNHIFFLNKPSKIISLRTLPQLEGFWILSENIFNTVDFSSERKRSLFTWLTEVNKRIKITELNYPRRFEALEEVEACIASVLRNKNV